MLKWKKRKQPPLRKVAQVWRLALPVFMFGLSVANFIFKWMIRRRRKNKLRWFSKVVPHRLKGIAYNAKLQFGKITMMGHLKVFFRNIHATRFI